MTDNLDAKTATESVLVSASKRISEQEEEKSRRVKVGDTAEDKPGKRWRSHAMAEDYISMVGNLMYPGGQQGPFGFDPSIGSFPMERTTTLGYLTSPLRRPSIVERWNPFEISVFEACLANYGKDFYKASKHLGKGKTTKDVIAFYYIWKKTKHYKRWKADYVVDYSGDSEDDDNAISVKGGRK